jgi:hypothetical protein
MARLGWLIGIVGLIVLSLSIDRALAQEIQGFPLSGDIPMSTQQPGCGGGTYSVTPSPDMRSIVHVSVEGFRAGDKIFSGSGTFPEGAVPLDSRGFFSVYFPGREPGQEITVYGSFVSSDELGDWGISVSPRSTCDGFGIGLPRPGGGPQLPDNGARPSARGGAPWTWQLAAVVLGLAALGTGLALRRRAR